MLRRQSAAVSQAKLTASNRFEIRNQDAEKIAAIKEGLKRVPGKDNTDKILYLLSLLE